ncbi:MAG: (3S)-malyl-CoA thioesterase [Gaiellaceae bacterium]|nr:(3S)-malyl-CoA thioesterase [Gaiellaceae bacterium]
MHVSTLRSLLFAPAAEERKLRKALTAGADAVIADLEDGTAPGEKEAGRAILEAVFAEDAPCARVVRLNAVDTPWFAGDLELAARLQVDLLMLPKATPKAVAALGAAGPPVLAIVETAAGLRLAYETGSADRVAALALGTHDLGAELRTTTLPGGLEFLYARSKVVTDSAAAGLAAPIDTVYLDTRDTEGLEREATLARSLGFGGKLCIHPAQVETVNRVFTPSEEELEWARRVLEAYRVAQRDGLGAVALDGKMVDLPIVRQAERLLGGEARGSDG